MRINEIFDSDEDEYQPTNLRLGRYRNPIDPRTGDLNPGFNDDQHIPNLELADDVDELIAAGQEPIVAVVNIDDLHASQDWLSDYGSGESTFPEYDDLPVVLRISNELNIVDGHHRISSLSRAGKKSVKVYLFKK